MLPHIQSHQSLDHLFPYRFVHREKQSHFHGEATEILDDAGQEDGRSRLVIVEDKPESIEPQMNQEHDEKKRYTNIGKSDFLMIEKSAKQKACQKIRQREAGEENARPDDRGADEIIQCAHQPSFPRSVESTSKCDGQKSEVDAHKGRLDGKDVGQKHGKPGQNAEHDQLMNFILGMKKDLLLLDLLQEEAFCSSGMQLPYRETG